MKFSQYNPDNREEIRLLFIKTFTDSENKSEGEIIGELVSNYMTNTTPNDIYCFTATDNGQIIGSIFFSKLTFASGVRAYILSPVAILTEFQRKGSGQELINFGLETLKQDGIEIALTYGDPNYYSKVGFKQITEELIKAPLKLSYPEGWLAQSLSGDTIEAIADKPNCVEALNKQELW